MWKKAVTLIGGVSLVLGLVGGIWMIEDRYATASDVGKEIYQLQKQDAAQEQKVESLEIRLDVKLLSDYRDELQGRIWKLEDRYQVTGRWKPGTDETIREIHQKMVADIANLDAKIAGKQKGAEE